jgi:D-lactate dehydrogenase
LPQDRPRPGLDQRRKIGGIAANNASGMCCGTAQNSYRTLAGMRVMLADGTVLDTEDSQSAWPPSRSATPSCSANWSAWAARRARNDKLAERIRHKYKIKNTTGYSLNALVDYEDPIDILAHLMIGSEGTLGFISRITYHTVVEDAVQGQRPGFLPGHPHRLRAPSSASSRSRWMRSSCSTARPAFGRRTSPACRRMRDLGEGAAALLIEGARAPVDGDAGADFRAVHAKRWTAYHRRSRCLHHRPGEMRDVLESAQGHLPGGRRHAPHRHHGDHRGRRLPDRPRWPTPRSTCSPASPSTATTRRSSSATRWKATCTSCSPRISAIESRGRPLRPLHGRRVPLVVTKYDGSLKAEHGTGRNMAPFVEMEWGKEAYRPDARDQALFDPENLLNPGVILNDNPHAHLEEPQADAGRRGHRRPLHRMRLLRTAVPVARADPVAAPAHRQLARTVAPRRRRRGSRPASARTTLHGPRHLRRLRPVLHRLPGRHRHRRPDPRLRGRSMGDTARAVNAWTGNHFGTLANASRLGLSVGHAVSGVLGDNFLGRISGGAWKKNMPHAGKAPLATRYRRRSGGLLPDLRRPHFWAIEFGEAAAWRRDHRTADPRRLRTAPARRLSTSCAAARCWPARAWRKKPTRCPTLEAALIKASENGRYPVIMDASSCTSFMQKHLAGRLKLYDFHEFAHDALLPRLMITKEAGPIALHVNCSVRKNGSDAKLKKLLAACADQIIEPAGVTCCGFAGDRGFVVPELNQHALRKIHSELPATCACGVSTNRTCEIGLTAETGLNYQSIAYLLEKCSRPQQTC